jgi:hypothetical protein
MAARKKVRASKKKQVASNMPPEMRAAMMGGRPQQATQANTADTNEWISSLSYRATDNALMSKHFYIECARRDEQGREILDEDGKPIDPLIFDKTVYWKPETPKQRDAYIVDLGMKRIASACFKCFFARALREDGTRVFTNESEFTRLQETGVTEFFEVIGGYMLGISDDDDDEPGKPQETTVESEKEG